MSALFYVDVTLQPGARLQISAEYTAQAIYIVQSSLDLGKNSAHAAGQLLALKPGAALDLRSAGAETTRVMLVGDERWMVRVT